MMTESRFAPPTVPAMVLSALRPMAPPGERRGFVLFE